MTLVEVRNNWTNWVEHYGNDDESKNNFCNTYATSYEEYMTLWELLTD